MLKLQFNIIGIILSHTSLLPEGILVFIEWSPANCHGNRWLETSSVFQYKALFVPFPHYAELRLVSLTFQLQESDLEDGKQVMNILFDKEPQTSEAVQTEDLQTLLQISLNGAPSLLFWPVSLQRHLCKLNELCVPYLSPCLSRPRFNCTPPPPTAESFSSKGKYLKRIRYHGRGMFGIMDKVYCNYFVKLVEGAPPMKETKTSLDQAKEYVQSLKNRTIIHSL